MLCMSGTAHVDDRGAHIRPLGFALEVFASGFDRKARKEMHGTREDSGTAGGRGEGRLA